MNSLNQLRYLPQGDYSYYGLFYSTEQYQIIAVDKYCSEGTVQKAYSFVPSNLRSNFTWYRTACSHHYFSTRFELMDEEEAMSKIETTIMLRELNK
jgi:hypothetical protein